MPTCVLPFQANPVCPKCQAGTRFWRIYDAALKVLIVDCAANDGCGHRYATEPADAPRGRPGRPAETRVVDLPDREDAYDDESAEPDDDDGTDDDCDNERGDEEGTSDEPEPSAMLAAVPLPRSAAGRA